MSSVLVDSSVWIDYFRSGNKKIAQNLDALIDMNSICTNDLILSELIPFLKHKKEFKLADLLQTLPKLLLEINWNEIIDFQIINLKYGINNVGISDLIILQNAIASHAALFSLDKHFSLMRRHINFKVPDFES